MLEGLPVEPPKVEVTPTSHTGVEPQRLGQFDGPVDAIIAAVKAQGDKEPPRVGPDQFHPDGIDQAWREAGTY